MNNDTPTPRTDAAEFQVRGRGTPMPDDVVYSSFARQLERELAEAKQQPHAMELQSYDRMITELEQKLAASQALEVQLRRALTRIQLEDIFDVTMREIAGTTLDSSPPPPVIPLADVKPLLTVLREIHDEADGYADGAPDASDHDKLCNQLVGQIRPLLQTFKSKHPEL